MGNRFGRREFLRGSAALIGAVARTACPAWAGTPAADFRSLAFHNLHTGERLTAEYWAKGKYIPDALAAVDHVLRDYRNNEVHVIDPRLLDIVNALQAKLESRAEVQVISGYRSPDTNARMHAESSSVAAHSLHMEGKVIDLRLGDIVLARLHDTVLAMRAGGVDYYPSPDFVHVDVGRVRRWGGQLAPN